VLGCRHRKRRHGPRGDFIQHQFGHQFLGLAAEEELAERQSSLHQELNGQGSAYLLNKYNFIFLLK